MANSLAFAFSMMPLVASAQPNSPINVFFGFDFVLQPIAIKWACQGERKRDLATFEALIAAFPEDADTADLRSHIDAMRQVPEGEEGLAQVLGGEISREHAEQLCIAARALSVAWVTPEQVIDDEDDGVPTEQRAAWAEFWEVIESLQ
jgi:hypothetical protein